jgi:hypothetical protein
MTKRIAEASPRSRARIFGVVYLLYFATAILGVVILSGLIVSGDAAATATKIMGNQPIYQLGVAIGLISLMLYVAITVFFYQFLKPVNRTIALLATLLSVVGCAIQALGTICQLAPLVVLSGSPYLSAFTTNQLHALAQMFLDLNTQAGYVSIVFFGVFDFAIGYLIFRSTFLPRFLGVLMMAAGVGWLTFLSPPFADHLKPFVEILGFVAELVLLLWLLIFGVDDQKWKDQAAASS